MIDILWTRGDPSAGNVEFVAVTVDATITEQHSSTSLITDHVVESGVNIVDHVRPEADRLSVEVFVTNTPVTSPGVDDANGAVKGAQIIPGIGPLSQLQRGVQGHLSEVPGFVKTGVALTGPVGGVVASALGGFPVHVSVDPAQWLASGTSGSASLLQFTRPFDRVKAVYDQLRELMTLATPLTLVTGIRTYEDMILTSITAPRDAANSNAMTMSLEFIQVRLVGSEVINEPEPLEVRAAKKKPDGRVDPPPIPPKPTREQLKSLAVVGIDTLIGGIRSYLGGG